MTAAALNRTSVIIGSGATKSGSSIRLIPAMYPRRIVSRSPYRPAWSTPVGATPDSLTFLVLPYSSGSQPGPQAL